MAPVTRIGDAGCVGSPLRRRAWRFGPRSRENEPPLVSIQCSMRHETSHIADVRP